MRILGIDPGMGCTGYGIVEQGAGCLVPVSYGVIHTPATRPLSYRLHQIYTRLQTVIASYQPQVAAVEEVFLAHNVKSALKLGQARGAAVLAAASYDLPLYEYSALAVKQAVVGYGRADKHQVQTMVQALLGLDKLPEPHDVADALAVAICHLHSTRIKARCQSPAK
jgi:crossover junction endodeoxyribonuclease RuvC